MPTEIPSSDGVAAKLDRLATTDDDLERDELEQSLIGVGSAVVEPGLRMVAASDDPAVRRAILSVLAQAGARDERIFELLMAQVRARPGDAGLLALYGDDRALPELSDALDRFEPVESGNPWRDHALIEIRAAIEDLGGVMTPEQQRKVHFATSRLRDVVDRRLDELSAGPSPWIAVVPAPAKRRERPGRNAPCWCGSAMKYKKCHLQADEELGR